MKNFLTLHLLYMPLHLHNLLSIEPFPLKPSWKNFFPLPIPFHYPCTELLQSLFCYCIFGEQGIIITQRVKGTKVERPFVAISLPFIVIPSVQLSFLNTIEFGLFTVFSPNSNTCLSLGMSIQNCFPDRCIHFYLSIRSFTSEFNA